MAEKGLISKTILSGFADEVRRLANVETTGTPSELLALLQNVTGGGGELISGTYTTAYALTNSAITLGINLPVYNNYVFIIYQTNATSGQTSMLNSGFIVSSNGTTSSGVLRYNKRTTSPNTLYITNFVNGTIEHRTSSTILGFVAAKHQYYYAGWN